MRVWLTERYPEPKLARRYDRLRLTHRYAGVSLHERTPDVPSDALVTSDGSVLVFASGAYVVHV